MPVKKKTDFILESLKNFRLVPGIRCLTSDQCSTQNIELASQQGAGH